VPNGRAALSSGADRGWTRIARGQRTVTLQDVSPGLYQMALLEYPGHVNDILYRTGADATLRYIWVPPTTGASSVTSQVPSALVIRDVYCNESVRKSWMSKRISATQKSLGMLNTGFVHEASGVWHGPCNNDNPDTTNTQETGEAGA
jgi:hypothetical protein